MISLSAEAAPTSAHSQLSVACSDADFSVKEETKLHFVRNEDQKRVSEKQPVFALRYKQSKNTTFSKLKSRLSVSAVRNLGRKLETDNSCSRRAAIVFVGKMQLLAWFGLVLLCVLQSTGACPSICKCSKKSNPEKSEVNCHKRGLRSLPSDLPTDVWILKLGENGITDLKANLLRSVPTIESLILEKNTIKSVHPKTFSGAKHLTLLNLLGNQITKLPPKVFKDLLNLRFLMLGQNEIGLIKAEMFVGMRNLSELDLPHNALTVVPSNAFKPLIALKVLDLSLNRIQRLSPKAFTGLTQLLFLNLDNNSLKTIPAGVFRPLQSLEMLVLDNNLLSSLSQSALDGLSSLQELYLRNNELELLPNDVFSNLPKLSELGLSGNHLKTVDGNTFSLVPELKKLHLHDNAWQCDCNIASLVKWMEQTNTTLSPRDALKCSSPPNLRNKNLIGLQTETLTCNK
ncbi:hypothetical protein OJAV_G00230800 [Oryzias javanicus]|uniref:LRRCT domain-containing protein n=1 Tax=Oryzias javanicus TaxID=123683 RepID=A0A437BZM4_ORYJA|nr:hypothetical protein OJAV_G00230800 [Oryzias javanicus]